MSARRRFIRPRARRGSTYVLILGVSVILMLIGLSAVTVSRVNARSVSTDNHWAEAQVLAFSGAEHALATIQATSDWRTKFGSDQTVQWGNGKFRWHVVDELDGDLTDNDADPFCIVSRGEVGQGAYATGLQCTVQGEPLDVLRCALHADSEVTLWSWRTVTAVNGPVSTNHKLRTYSRSVLTGDVEASNSVSNGGTITGTVTTSAPKKTMPDKNVFDIYRSLATRIDPGSMIYRQVLGPGVNPWGSPNARGIYYIDAPGRTVIIYSSRIYGTLVVRCNRLYLTGTVLIQPSQKDQPSLLVDGDVYAYLTSDGQVLREGSGNPNFNPAGAPYDGHADSDQSDTYPSEIQGLVHLSANLYLGSTARVRGVVLVGKRTYIYGYNEIIRDESIYKNPPMGYTTGTGAITPESWKRVLD